MIGPKVFLTGGDGIGWALDEDLKLTRGALEGSVEFTELADCGIVHSVWWEALLRLPRNELVGKHVICHVPGEPYRYFALPSHRHALSIVNHWVVRSTQAQTEFKRLGVEATLIPYCIDTMVF